MKQPIVKWIAGAGIVLLILGLSGTAYYFYRQYKKASQNPQKVAAAEVLSYVTKISQYMDLPTDESPTLATIVDKDKLKDQPFFQKSQNGDKVLIYTKIRRAILYRPSTNKVIDMVPLTINDQSAVPVKPSPTGVAAKVRVVVLNGTTVANLAKTVEQKISGIDGIQVTGHGNAARSDYGQTVVVDLTGNYAGLASDMAQLVNGKVQTLPDGETQPDADILIIAGK